jgi:ATP-dependent Zn protease
MDGSGLMKAATSRGPSDFQNLKGTKKVTFADVHGCEEAKAELQEVVVS